MAIVHCAYMGSAIRVADSTSICCNYFTDSFKLIWFILRVVVGIEVFFDENAL